MADADQNAPKIVETETQKIAEKNAPTEGPKSVEIVLKVDSLDLRAGQTVKVSKEHAQRLIDANLAIHK